MSALSLIFQLFPISCEDISGLKPPLINSWLKEQMSDLDPLAPWCPDWHVLSRQGFDWKVTVCRCWNNNAQGVSKPGRHSDSSIWNNLYYCCGRLCNFQLGMNELRSKLAQRRRRQTCSQTHRQIDSAIWGVKCKWMQSDDTDRKGTWWCEFMRWLPIAMM